jgi:hypothetical protein
MLNVLSVRDGECDGRQIACNDDDPGRGLWSTVEFRVGPGQTKLVVVEGAPLPPTLREGVEPEQLPEDSMVGHRVMPRLDLNDLVLLFGAEGADLIFNAAEGAWVAGYQSVRGEHWFRIKQRFASETPSLEQIRDVVRNDWITENEDERLASAVSELRARYTVVVEANRDQP